MQSAFGIGEVVDFKMRDQLFDFFLAGQQSGNDYEGAQILRNSSFEFETRESSRTEPVSDSTIDQGDGEVGGGNRSKHA